MTPVAPAPPAASAAPATAPVPTPAPPAADRRHRPAPAPPAAPPGAPPARPRGRLRRLWRGRPADPAWARPALLALLAATAALYLWDLAASGYANSFYAAAAQAAGQDWKAWFFGSLDPSNFITVDKPPASLWVMGLSVRLFGLNSWALLVPQALMGVGAVALLHAAVRRWSGPGAGLLAGAALATTPAAALMFRYDHPDALLTGLLVAAGYCTVRALEAARTRWLLLAGVAVGFAFLTKMLQGFLVLPAFVLVYLVAAPTPLRRRLLQLVAAAGAVVVSAGWWVLAVALWPADSRPYIGGSTDNTVLDLVLGYNGLSRLSGGSGGTGGTSGSNFGGATGWTRLFGSEMGFEISWLLPAALVALALGLWATRRAPRTDRTRAALLLWGGWMLVTGAVFSWMSGIIHPYYTVAMAPAVAAVVAVGAAELARRRESLLGRVGLAALVVAAGAWSAVLLGRVPDWYPGLRVAVVVLTAVSALAFLAPPRRLGRFGAAALVVACVAGLLGPAAFSAATAASAHTGSIPSAGPAEASGASAGMGGGGMGGGGMGGTRPSGQAPSETMGQAPSGTSGSAPTGGAPSGTSPSGSDGGQGGGTGGGQTGGETSTELAEALAATTTTWAAATVGDTSAAQLQLAGGRAVMAIGGWNGSDPTPTLEQFKQYVADGKITYFISGGGGGGGGQGTSSEITEWVTSTFTATTIGGTTVYDLTSAASDSTASGSTTSDSTTSGTTASDGTASDGTASGTTSTATSS